MPRGIPSLLALALLTGLSGVLVAADEKTPTTPYYPLAVGDTWSYRAGDNRFQLKVTEISKEGRATVELQVAGKKVSWEQVGVTKDAVVRYTFEGKEAKPPIEFLKFPPKPDVSWPIKSDVLDGKGGKLPVEGTFKAGKEEEVKVPAGVYKAAVVSGEKIKANGVMVTRLTYYFAEKVGMVKQVIELEGNKVTIELEKFERAPSK
jgi:hypothetical protein